MKRFIVYSILFSNTLLLIFIGIELLLFLRPNTYSYKHEYVETHINDIQVLLFGNSHIENALKPNLMGDGVFNFAIAGRNLIYDIELAKKHLPNMGNLKVVVMPLDYISFYLGRETSNRRELGKDRRFLPNTFKCMYYKYMGIRIDEPFYWSEILNSNQNYMSRFWQNDEDARGCDSLGYSRLKLEERVVGWEYSYLPNKINSNKKIDKEKYEQLYQGYRVFANLASKHDARLVLLGTPMYKTCQELMNKDVEKEILVFVNELQSEYPNVEYYDFTYDNRFKPNDFYNSSHLTDLGAEKFSKIVAEIINAPFPI